MLSSPVPVVAGIRVAASLAVHPDALEVVRADDGSKVTLVVVREAVGRAHRVVAARATLLWAHNISVRCIRTN